MIEFVLPRPPPTELARLLALPFAESPAAGAVEVRSTAGELVTEIDRDPLDPELVRQLEELGYPK